MGDFTEEQEAGMSSVGRKEAVMYTYRVRASANGFSAYCREMDIGSEGNTVAVAIDALRTAIETKHQES